jgi:hypothetical protein
MTPAEQIAALAQGDYPKLTRDAINAGANIDTFFADMLTLESQQPVQIIFGATMTAREIVFATVGTSVSAAGGNVGNGTLAVDAIGKSVLSGIYVAECVSTRANRGIFELRRPNGAVVARMNVGTAAISYDLELTITDGSTDFAVSDTFNITVTMGAPYFPCQLTATDMQIAVGILAADVDATGGATEQFAVVNGPAIVSANGVHIPPWIGPTPSIAAYNALIVRSVEQLANRGIVLRGDVQLLSGG